MNELCDTVVFVIERKFISRMIFLSDWYHKPQAVNIFSVNFISFR